jgi:hypothetical protein
MYRPGGWARLLSDCYAFLDSPWVDRVVDLGLGPVDLFGWDAIAHWARIDRLGLIWLLDGRGLVAMTHDTAVNGTAQGGALTYRHRPISAEQATPRTVKRRADVR